MITVQSNLGFVEAYKLRMYLEYWQSKDCSHVDCVLFETFRTLDHPYHLGSLYIACLIVSLCPCVTFKALDSVLFEFYSERIVPGQIRSRTCFGVGVYYMYSQCRQISRRIQTLLLGVYSQDIQISRQMYKSTSYVVSGTQGIDRQIDRCEKQGYCLVCYFLPKY